MTIAERLHKIAAKEDAAGGFVSVGGFIIDIEAIERRRRESADQKRRDREDDFMWRLDLGGDDW